MGAGNKYSAQSGQAAGWLGLWSGLWTRLQGTPLGH